MTQQLVFVYNAGSDLFSTVADFAHKLFSPSTYQCKLCALTYGNFSIKEEWKTFIENLGIEAVFLHKDEFEKQHNIQVYLPAVFISTNGTIIQLVSKREIDGCQSLEELKALVLQKLKGHVQHYHSNIQ